MARNALMRWLVTRGAVGAGVGSVFPALYLISEWVGLGVWRTWLPSSLVVALWPQWIMFMETDGQESNHLFVAEVTAIAFSTNAACWAVSSIACFWVFERFIGQAKS